MKNQRAFSDLLFIIVVLFLAFASYISYQRITKQNQASNLVAHANLVKFKLGETISLLKLSEKKEQDSIRARDDIFNGQLQNDSLAADQLIRELDSLTQHDKDQHVRILQLNSLLQKRLSNLHDERARAEKLSADLTNYTQEGQSIVNRIQMLFIEMRHVEDDLLLQKIQEKDRSAFLIPLFSLIFSFIAIILVTGTYFRLRNETRLRLQAENAREIIHNFFNQTPAMMAIMRGPDHRFEFVNPSYRELIGGRDPVNKTIREALPEVAGQGHYELLDSVYATGKPYIGKEMPLEINRGNGVERVYINLIYQALKNSSGKTDGILVFCYDVSEMVLASNKLQESENRSRLAIEAARMGTFDWNLQDQHFISSERLVEIFGYQSAEKTSHQDLLDRFHPVDKKIRDEAVNNSFKTGFLKYEARLIWPDKSIHWINVFGKILTDNKRNILRMYGTVVDITEQKIALEELKESESKFRLLANALPQQIWTADKNGNMNYFNQAVYDYSALSYSEIENQGWLSIVHPDDRSENIRKWAESVATGNEFVFEHRFRKSNGEFRWQLSRAIPQKDNGGNIQMWIGTSTDIQDQKHFMQELEEKVSERTQSLNYANLALNQTVSKLEQTNSELASFNYIASHDLQEPLRKIIAFSKRIEDLEKQNLSESSQDYFNRIIHAASRMQNLINAFLSYSQTNNIQAELEKTDFNQIFLNVKNDFADSIEQKNVLLECGPMPVLMGIPLQINQLFTNLLGNAIKYSRADLRPEIEIFSEKISGKDLLFEDAEMNQYYWKISIRDNGIGFDQIYENQIFELFQRLHSRQEFEGTGIGLSICRKIMRNHKGFISASGIPGSGAIFSMYFPALLES